MNGLKLGGNQKAKNSFAFENEFMDYGDDNEAQSENQQEEDEYEEEGSESYAKQSSQGNGKLMVESNLKNNKSMEIVKKPDQKKRIKKLNNGMEKLSVSILEMKQKYKDLDMEEVLFKKRSERKQNQIKSFLHDKHEEKKQLQRKMKKIKEKERKKLQESLHLEEEEKRSIPKRRVEEHLRKIVEAKERRQVEKQKQAMKGDQVSQMYSRIREEERVKKKFHLRKMEEDTKKKIAQMEKEREYLAKRRQNYKPLDYDKLDEHAQRHDELLKQLQAVKLAQREEEYKKILENNQKLQEIYRGQNYEYIQEEFQQRKLKRKEPKLKAQKIKNYQEYIRQNFIPKTHQKPSKSVQIDSSRAHSHKQVKRYRYFQGISYGEVVENRPLAKSEAEQRKIGNNYMAYVKSLPKRKKQQVQQQISMQDLQLLDQKLNSIVKVKRDRNPLYERSGRKSLEVKISDKPNRDELNMVIKQLKNKDEEMKMKEKVVRNQGGSFLDYSNRHRQINQNIVDNIERKLNLLSKL